MLSISNISHAWEGKNISNIADISSQPIAIQVGILALKGCMQQYLSEQTMAQLESNIVNAVKNVQFHCQANNESAAYNAVIRYSNRPEITVARKCIQQLEPMLDNTNLKNLLGEHESDVNKIIAGEIPTPICR